MGSVYLILFTGWAFFNRHQPHVRKLVAANFLIIIFALFEVFDFPPIWGLLDAHAVWHAATPIASYLTYSFVVDDAAISTGAQISKTR